MTLPLYCWCRSCGYEATLTPLERVGWALHAGETVVCDECRAVLEAGDAVPDLNGSDLTDKQWKAAVQAACDAMGKASREGAIPILP